MLRTCNRSFQLAYFLSALIPCVWSVFVANLMEVLKWIGYFLAKNDTKELPLIVLNLFLSITLLYLGRWGKHRRLTILNEVEESSKNHIAVVIKRCGTADNQSRIAVIVWGLWFGLCIYGFDTTPLEATVLVYVAYVALPFFR